MQTVPRTLTRLGLLWSLAPLAALGVSACSSHLDLGHDLRDRVLAPSVPDTAGTPNAPSAPNMPSKPGVPDTPDTADASDSPDASSAPTQPVVPTAPDEPTASTCVGIPCFGGPVLVLATSTGSAKGLVVDADNVFWAATAGQAMMITPKDGTTDTTAVMTPNAGPFRVAADDARVYFTSALGGYVAWFPKAARSSRGPRLSPTVTVLVQDEPEPQSIVIASDGVYFADGQAGTIKRATLDRTVPPVTLVRGLSDGAELAIDGTSLYYVDSALGEIHAVDRVTNEDTLLASGLEHPVAPVLSDDDLYFLELGTETTSYTDGRLLRMRRTGGAADVLMDHLEAPTGLTADTAAVYLCTRGTARNQYKGRIVRLANDGEVSTLAVDQPDPFGIAVDGSGVYWTTDSDNALHFIAR